MSVHISRNGSIVIDGSAAAAAEHDEKQPAGGSSNGRDGPSALQELNDVMEQLTNTYPQSQRDTNEFIPSALTVRQGNGGGHPDSLRLSQQKALALSTTSHAMKDRLRAKNRNELQLAQQLQNSRSNKVVLQNQIELERQNRDLIQRELRDVQGQLNSLRQRYDDKSKKEIETLKKLGKAEIDLKDVNTRLDDAKEAESRARRAADQLRTRASRLEKDLFQVRFEHSSCKRAAHCQESP